MIAVPLAGIIVLLAIKSGVGGGGAESEAPKTVDPNARLLELEKQITEMEREYGEIQRLRQSEDATVDARQEALIARIDNWQQQWDAILEPMRNAETGALPFEYQGYQQSRARVNVIRMDLLKTGGF